MTMNHSYEHIRGLRYINWVRCSTKRQSDTSLVDQLRMLNAFADGLEMTHIDDVILDGISGLSPKVNKLVSDLIQRKRQHDDFDVILVHDLSRLTRGGVEEGHAVMFGLRSAGIEVISIKDPAPHGEFGELHRSLTLLSANQQSKAIAMSTTRGSMSALADNRMPHSHNAPFGTDRLVLGPNDVPRFLLHNLADGRQQKLEHPSRRVLEIFDPNPRSGGPNHYRLQKGERTVLVPGDPDEIRAVHLMYQLCDGEGLGDHRIARRLNDEGIPSPRGKQWSTNTVNKILRNPIYLGRGLANRSTTGRYYMRSPQGPIATNRSFEELQNYTQPPRRPREQSDWMWIEQLALAEFLPHDIRELAARRQAAFFDRAVRKLGSRRAAAKDRDRHRDSYFILKHRLTEASTGLPMTGRTSRNAKGTRTWRYYGVTKAYAKPASDSPIPTRFYPAEPINQLVLRALGHVLRQMPQLKAILRRQLETTPAPAPGSAPGNAPGSPVSGSGPIPGGEAVQAQQLQDQLAAVERQISYVIKRVPIIGEKAADAELSELAGQRDRINRQIKRAHPAPGMSSSQIDALVEHLVRQLENATQLVEVTGMPVVRRLLDLLLHKAVVDVHTRHVELEFRLPQWALDDPQALCLALDHDSMSAHEAEAHGGLVLMRFKGWWLGNRYIGIGKAA